MKKIEEFTVRMDSFDVYQSNGKQSKIFYPNIKVKYVGIKKKHELSVDQLVGRFGAEDLKGATVCGSFFVLRFKIEWEIITSDGALVKSMGPCGQIVGCDEDSFFVRHHGVLTAYNIKGDVIGQRNLTSEEIVKCDKDFGKESDE